MTKRIAPVKNAAQRVARPIGAALLATTCLSHPQLAVAQQSVGPVSGPSVTLKLKEGGFQVSGQLLTFDGQTYSVASPAFGRMTFEAARFDCEGAGCPRPGAATQRPTAAQSPTAPPIATPVATLENGPEAFIIRGSPTVGDALMPSLVRAFGEARKQTVTRRIGSAPNHTDVELATASGQPAASITIERKGTPAGYQSLVDGSAELAIVDRPPTPQELVSLTALSPDIRTPKFETVLALDGLVFATHPSRAVRLLTRAQVADIYAGVITNWSQLGQEAAPITAIITPGPTTGRQMLDQFILKPQNRVLGAAVTTQPSLSQTAKEIAADRNAIGLTSVAFIDNVNTLGIQNSCGLPAYATAHAIKTGDYALNRRLLAFSHPNSKSVVAQALLAFAKTEAGQVIAAENRYIDQNIEPYDAGEMTPRMTYAPRLAAALGRTPDWLALNRDIAQARRLTVSFRFSNGRVELDAKALQDIDRLAQHLAKPEFKGREVQLIGFTDTLGSYPQNISLSARRANQVRQALLQVGGAALRDVRFTAKGYGPQAPITCNDDPNTKDLNRRVEVWVR